MDSETTEPEPTSGGGGADVSSTFRLKLSVLLVSLVRFRAGPPARESSILWCGGFGLLLFLHLSFSSCLIFSFFFVGQSGSLAYMPTTYVQPFNL